MSGSEEKLERNGHVVRERYGIEKFLARGGMSILYQGRDTQSGRPVVIKSMRPFDFQSKSMRDRFMVEIRAAGRLSHPNIVKMLDSGEDENGSPLLIMEMLEGKSLQQELDRVNTLPIEQVFYLLLPLLGALSHAHDQGIIHRDIKPANIFLCTDAGGKIVPKMLDFGISMVRDSTRVTESGLVVGTVQYMSPEQAQGLEIGPPTDIWAMGAVFFRCLAGKVPFEGEQAANVLLNIVSKPPPDLTAVACGVGPRVASTIERALRYDVSKRYADIRAFAQALCASACAEAIPLPQEPDPIGLPDWRKWLSGELSYSDYDTTKNEQVLVKKIEISREGKTPTHTRDRSPWVRSLWIVLFLLGLLIAGISVMSLKYVHQRNHTDFRNTVRSKEKARMSSKKTPFTNPIPIGQSVDISKSTDNEYLQRKEAEHTRRVQTTDVPAAPAQAVNPLATRKLNRAGKPAKKNGPFPPRADEKSEADPAVRQNQADNSRDTKALLQPITEW
ncbi:MAG: serine/threonine protein kinase [Deltaproteobacteria bacterium]|nr:serine/threonine protein kinase [Deltaproteobacteria bacterium]